MLFDDSSKNTQNKESSKPWKDLAANYFEKTMKNKTFLVIFGVDKMDSSFDINKLSTPQVVVAPKEFKKRFRFLTQLTNEYPEEPKAKKSRKEGLNSYYFLII